MIICTECKKEYDIVLEEHAPDEEGVIAEHECECGHVDRFV